jgi:hypothetical protein
MTEKKKKADTSPHPLVKAGQAKVESAKGECVVLVGYFGKALKNGHVRLYTGLDFSSYYEIPNTEEAIIHIEWTDTGDENSPTSVWVAASTKVDFVRTGVLSYLKGAITGGHLASAKAASAEGAEVARKSLPGELGCN